MDKLICYILCCFDERVNKDNFVIGPYGSILFIKNDESGKKTIYFKRHKRLFPLSHILEGEDEQKIYSAYIEAATDLGVEDSIWIN